MTIAMNNSHLKQLQQLIVEIESLFPLDYSNRVNRLFWKLQEQLKYFEKLPQDIVNRLQIIWGYRGYSMESHFAKQKNYQSFDFYPKYKKLMRFDTLFLRKVMGKKKYSKVIFVGSGALPLSLKLLRLNIQKVGYDISKEALNLAKKAIPKDRFGRNIIYKEGNFFDLNLNEKRPIIIYIAGLIRGKEVGLKRFVKQLPKGSLMVVRTVANDSRGFLYEKIEKQSLYRIGELKEFIPIKSSGVTNGMIVIKI
ncbi:MAG TPA: hypothetical protein ENK79_01605 [Campylobacterales bacterium]|nr:hypothetical protein [Campylobacterales bacterium]